jgi:hypothetical protein
MNMRNSKLQTIQIMVNVYGKSRPAAKKYSCWLCDKECRGTTEYLMHLQEHKDAIERQKI